MVQQKLVSSEKANKDNGINQDELQLRFKDFNECWETKKLDSLLDVCYGKDYKHLNEGNFPVLGTGGVMGYVDEYLYSGESILIGRKGTIDKPKYINGPFWTVDTLFYTKIKEGNPKFIFYQLNKINWLKYNEASGVPSLSANNIKNIKIKIPSLEEQKKIASFLSAVDKKIELLERKRKKYEEIKKYFLNEIFVINNYAYKTSLGELCTIQTGKLDANAMVENGAYRFYTCAKEYYQIDKYEFDTEALLISGNGAHVGYIHYYNGKFNAYQRTYVLNDFNEDIDIKYVKYFLEKHLHKQIWKEKKEGNTPYIVLSTLKNMEIIYPNLKEQQLIKNLFENIDKKVDLCYKETNYLKEFKKGLLQKMFV